MECLVFSKYMTFSNYARPKDIHHGNTHFHKWILEQRNIHGGNFDHIKIGTAKGIRSRANS